jgi:hypothetical protein
VHDRWTERAQEHATAVTPPHALLDLSHLEAEVALLGSSDGATSAAGPNMAQGRSLLNAVLAVLLRLELGLRRELLAFHIAAAVFRRHALAQDVTGLWELRHGDRLLAWVDFVAKRIEFDEFITHDELAQMHWLRVERLANGIKQAHAMALPQAMWLFSCFSREHLMTMHYRFARMRMVQLPQIDPRYMTRCASRVLSELSDGRSLSYKELAQRCDTDGKLLSNTLAGLFFVGALQAIWDETPGLPHSGWPALEDGELVSGTWHLRSMARMADSMTEHASLRVKRIAQQHANTLRSWQ